jgi:uridine kinase
MDQEIQPTIRVSLPSGNSAEFPYGIRVVDLLKNEEFNEIRESAIGGLINNDVVSMTFKVEVNAVFKPLTMTSQEGARIFRRSLCFLLNTAAIELFPERRLIIGHSLGDNYYFYFDDDPQITGTDVGRLETRMKELVSADLPVVRRVLSYGDALAYLKETGNRSAELLLENRSDSKIPIYECCGFRDIAHGPLVQRLGMLKNFELTVYPPGFLLRFPAAKKPDVLGPLKEHPVVFSIFQEYKQWGKVLGISNAGQLNDRVRQGRIKDFIQVAEALHDKKISEIANAVEETRDTVRVILIAGPSSSGKTTFTKKLSVQLRVLGFSPIAISVDDYFLPREQTPKDEHGDLDFESLEALDIELLNTQLKTLLDGGEVEIPNFDFKLGRPKPEGTVLKLKKRNIIIIEGIHCLNPRLTYQVKPESKFSIYVSALTQLNIDDHNRIPTTDVRLLRRMVRDYQFRGNSALETLSRWPSVRKGEMRNIFPHEGNAQEAFNSSLDYELAILKGHADPLLRTIKPFDSVYGEAARLRRFLENFTMVPSNYTPYYSILREFIGDSGFTY